MKNRRDVCAATEAGFTEYEGLVGAIKTGCQQSPGYQSKYCYSHSPRIATISSDEPQQSTTKEGVVGVILTMKQTRNGVYYQVYIHVHPTSLSVDACTVTNNIYINCTLCSWFAGFLGRPPGKAYLGASFIFTTHTNQRI